MSWHICEGLGGERNRGRNAQRLATAVNSALAQAVNEGLAHFPSGDFSQGLFMVMLY